MTTQGVVATARRSNEVKMRRKKTRAKSMKSINSIDCVDVILQSVMTYNKYFLDKLNLKPYSYSICSAKIGHSDF
jgi:hypothetical protein